MNCFTWGRFLSLPVYLLSGLKSSFYTCLEIPEVKQGFITYLNYCRHKSVNYFSKTFLLFFQEATLPQKLHPHTALFYFHLKGYCHFHKGFCPFPRGRHWPLQLFYSKHLESKILWWNLIIFFSCQLCMDLLFISHFAFFKIYFIILFHFIYLFILWWWTLICTLRHCVLMLCFHKGGYSIHVLNSSIRDSIWIRFRLCCRKEQYHCSVTLPWPTA